MDRETAKAINDFSKKLNEVEKKLNDFILMKTEIIETTETQSDKLGYNWKITKVGDLEVKKEYVEQNIKVGTEENPIDYYEGVALIDNAFYLKEDGKLYVYMNGEWAEW